VYQELSDFDLAAGLSALPADQRELIRELTCYYDNLGALVAHGVVDVDIVAGYLGSAIVSVWETASPLIKAERTHRNQVTYDHQRWQLYYENLYHLIRTRTPDAARAGQRLWRIAS
jgi:hypothetical protein